MSRILIFCLSCLVVLGLQTFPVCAQTTPDVKTVKTSPLDEPLALIAKGKQVYQNVQDYSCTMVSQERIRGKLQPEQVILFKFRNQPYSVAMKWMAPKKLKGQEVYFVWGKNDNKMRVLGSGIKRIAGFVSIGLQDPRAKANTNHSITEAGIWALMEKTRKDWERERQFNRVKVEVGDFVFHKRPCKRVEVTYLQHVPEAYCYRTVLFVDSQTSLPVRVECYDWPTTGGQAGGDLKEVFSYMNMQYNLNLTDQDFIR